MEWRAMLEAGLRVLDRMMDREKIQRDLDQAFSRIRELESSRAELESRLSLLERGIGNAGTTGGP